VIGVRENVGQHLQSAVLDATTTQIEDLQRAVHFQRRKKVFHSFIFEPVARQTVGEKEKKKQ
jgi:hypothetical protein